MADEQEELKKQLASLKKIRREKVKLKQSMGDSGSIADPLAQGVTLGFGDEIAGALGAGAAYLTGNIPEGQGFGDAYTEIRDNARRQQEEFAQRNPGTALAAEVAGGLLTGGAGLAKGVQKLGGAGMNKVLAGTITGAGEGAIAGAGTSRADTVGGVVQDAAKGAAIGAPLGAGSTALINKFMRKSDTQNALAKLIEDQPANVDTAGKRLAEVGEQGFTARAADKLPGVKGSTVQKFMDKITPGGTGEAGSKAGAGARVKTDKLADDAITQGFDPGVIAPIQRATRQDSQKMLKMVDMMERGKKDKLYQVKNRPSDIAGDSLVQRVDHVLAVNRKAAGELDGVANGLKGQQVKFDDVVDDFTTRLDDMGINLETGVDGKITPNFQGSDVEGLEGVENVLNKIVKRMRDTKEPDAHDLHRLKKYIDENVSYSKRTEGLSGKVEHTLKKLRRNVDQRLDEQFPEYNRVNTTYADTRGAIDDLQDAVGNKLDLKGGSADKALGQELRKLMSNYKSRIGLLDSIPGLEDTAKKYGKTFDDDLLLQTLFVDELNGQFGSVARTSLAGETGKAVEKGIEASTGGIKGAARAFANKYDDFRGINDENAFKAMRELLKRQMKQGKGGTNLPATQ